MGQYHCKGLYSLDLRKKIVEPVKKGVSKSETARRFGVNRSTVGRYLLAAYLTKIILSVIKIICLMDAAQSAV